MDSSAIPITKFESLIDKYDYYIFDLDGTVWTDGILIEGALKTLTTIKEKGKKIFFLTNSSSSTRETYIERLKKVGISTELENFYSAGYLSLRYVTDNWPEVKKIYLIGGKVLAD